MDIDIAVTVLRVAATVLTATALLCWARVGPGPLCAGLSALLVVMIAHLDGRWMMSLDASVESWAAAHRSSGLRAVASWVFDAMANPIVFVTVMVICSAVITRRARSLVPASTLVAAVVLTAVIETALKATVGRVAPTVAGLQDPEELRIYGPILRFVHSFPSGHVAGTAVFIGLVSVMLGSGRSFAVKARLWTLATVGVGFVGLLAVYVRAHTLTDVLGGMTLGAAMVALGTVVLFRRLAVRPGPYPSYGLRRPASGAAELAPATS